MAVCNELKKGDVLWCKSCNLELRVEKTCECGNDDDMIGTHCSVPLQCCGMPMEKKDQ
ncbi:MAG: hypothetical protein MI749_19615 [Desulfovibrionales bacterium]|nr:hypothetical protein [Desulfovibrionales bacterium]